MQIIVNMETRTDAWLGDAREEPQYTHIIWKHKTTGLTRVRNFLKLPWTVVNVVNYAKKTYFNERADDQTVKILIFTDFLR